MDTRCHSRLPVCVCVFDGISPLILTHGGINLLLIKNVSKPEFNLEYLIAFIAIRMWRKNRKTERQRHKMDCKICVWSVGWMVFQKMDIKLNLWLVTVLSVSHNFIQLVCLLILQTTTKTEEFLSPQRFFYDIKRKQLLIFFF